MNCMSFDFILPFKNVKNIGTNQNVENDEQIQSQVSRSYSNHTSKFHENPFCCKSREHFNYFLISQLFSAIF